MQIRTFLSRVTLAAALAALPATTASAASPQRVTGGGSFLFAGTIPMQFGFSALALPNGTAVGSFHHAYTDEAGSYQFFGRVTCVTFDAELGRAWVGGVLTNVISNDPAVGLEAGDDAWFRVLDSPDGDRSTAMGFVGTIPSSAEYCATQPWPADNARTHPVTSGQITVDAG